MTADRKLDELRAAVTPLLHSLASRKDLPSEGHWVYKRDGSGRVETKLSWIALIQQHEKEISALEPKVTQWIATHYPDHSGMVGTSTEIGQLQPHSVLWTIAMAAYDRHEKFNIDQDQLDAILAEVDQFFRDDSYHFDVFAVAYNIQGDANLPPISFPGGLTLRSITDEELTKFYGGNPMLQVGPMPKVMPQFVFVKELSLPKVFGSPAHAPAHPTGEIFADLDRSMLALASFKEGGAVGYDGIRFEPRGISFGPVGGMTYRTQEVPWAPYKLEAADVVPLGDHIKLFTPTMHSSLEIACQRLVDAGRRTKPRDAIMDAVIGLESILLTGLKDELSYRFRLNYSTLMPSDRRGAFNLAKDLYKWRSLIAHGESVADTVKFNGQPTTLHDVAEIAKNALRSAISAFKESPNNPAYLAEGYWDDLHLR